MNFAVFNAAEKLDVSLRGDSGDGTAIAQVEMDIKPLARVESGKDFRDRFVAMS